MLLDGVSDFVKMQSKNFRVMIARDFIVQISGRRQQAQAQLGGYEALFLRRLGASPIEIGLANSLASLTRVLFSVPAGWLTDRAKNIKKTYVTSSGLGLLNYLIMSLITTWPVLLALNLWRTIGDSLSTPAKTIIDVDSLKNKDRVTGLSIHRTMTAVGGVIGPLVAAYIITASGGLDSADSFRPFFLFQFVLNLVIFILIWRSLNDVVFERGGEEDGFLQSFRSVFHGRGALKILFYKEIVQSFFALMSGPFLGIYQVDVKRATAFIIGYMGAGEMIVDVLLSVPIGDMIARFGRRRIAITGQVVGLVARCLLFLTPPSHPEILILYGVLGSVEGCMYLGWDAFALEVVPQEVRGRYLGLRAVAVGLVGVFAPVLGGVIWGLGPDLLWWINAFQWGFIVFPLMVILMKK
jgi:MFS family permease